MALTITRDMIINAQNEYDGNTRERVREFYEDSRTRFAAFVETFDQYRSRLEPSIAGQIDERFAQVGSILDDARKIAYDDVFVTTDAEADILIDAFNTLLRELDIIERAAEEAGMTIDR